MQLCRGTAKPRVLPTFMDDFAGCVHGIRSCQGVWFSEFGTLLSTAASFVDKAHGGYFRKELDKVLHVGITAVTTPLCPKAKSPFRPTSSRPP